MPPGGSTAKYINNNNQSKSSSNSSSLSDPEVITIPVPQLPTNKKRHNNKNVVKKVRLQGHAGVPLNQENFEAISPMGVDQYILPPLSTHLELFRRHHAKHGIEEEDDTESSDHLSSRRPSMQRSASAFGELGAQTATCM